MGFEVNADSECQGYTINVGLASANHYHETRNIDDLKYNPEMVGQVKNSDMRSPAKIAFLEPINQKMDPTGEMTRIEDIYAALGGYSWFQFLVTMVILLPEIPACMIAIAPIFTGRSIDVQVVCETGWKNGSESIVMKTIFKANDEALCSSNCSSIRPIGERNYYFYGYESIVEEFNLFCEKAWLIDTMTSIQMAGMMTGSFLGSVIADKYGRKKSYYIACLAMAVFATISGLATNIYMYGATRYLAGVGVGSFYVVFNIYLIEFLTPNYRTIAGCVSLWCIGEMLLAFLAYNIKSWRILTMLTGAPTLIVFVSYPYLPESPRWLLCQNRTKEATCAFARIAKCNFKNPIDSLTISKVQKDILNEKKANEESGGTSSGGSKFPIVGILADFKMCTSLLLFLFGWFSCALVYYGITFNAKSLSGSPYMNVFLLGLVDMPAFPSGALFSNCVGRKKTYSSFLLFASAFLFAIVIVELTVGLSSYPDLVTILCFLGKFGIGGAWGIVSCFTAEAFPTNVRSTCLGLCSLSCNIGGVLAPQLAYLSTISNAIPYFIFCGLTVTSAFLSWFLQETYGQPLKNFVQHT